MTKTEFDFPIMFRYFSSVVGQADGTDDGSRDVPASGLAAIQRPVKVRTLRLKSERRIDEMISFGIKADGMKKIERKLAEIEKLAAGKQPFRGIQLLDVDRAGDTADNSVILEELGKRGYRFAVLSRGEEQEIVDAFEEVLQKQLAGPTPNAANVAANALKAAMAQFGKIVVRHIESGENVTGDLSEAYKIQKQREHGFVYPIGKATGQLIDNLVGGKVKLTR